jgi:exopolysaccharide biosynthesis WecB/TagA/CpsF family protein
VKRRILGIDFFVGPLEAAVDQALAGGLVVAPSGPGLAVDLVESQAYRAAMQSADLALTDSGWMILLWRLYTRERLPRHSGLKFIRAILDRPELKELGAVFWVMPTADDDVRNRAWLAVQGFPVTPADAYLAPHYGSGMIADDVLVRRIQERRPKIIILAIGGGVQERLGHALQQQLEYQPTICCLGAAIAFLSGGQANIPPWADRLFLGWLFRLLSSPSRYFPRYWSALRLAPILWSNRDQLPPLKAS